MSGKQHLFSCAICKKGNQIQLYSCKSMVVHGKYGIIILF